MQDGILPGTPTAFAQTTDGYLWIGTRAGLLRFDGVRYARLEDQNKNLLQNRFGHSLLHGMGACGLGPTMV